jgi:hypothetical protein
MTSCSWTPVCIKRENGSIRVHDLWRLIFTSVPRLNEVYINYFKASINDPVVVFHAADPESKSPFCTSYSQSIKRDNKNTQKTCFKSVRSILSTAAYEGGIFSGTERSFRLPQEGQLRRALEVASVYRDPQIRQ